MKNLLLGKKDRELIDHTRDVLTAFRGLKNLLSVKPSEFSPDFDLLETLALSVIMHDVGKAATGFQKILQNGSGRWKYRHEIVSACLLDALDFPSNEMKHASIFAVITHHKDLEYLTEKYLPGHQGTVE